MIVAFIFIAYVLGVLSCVVGLAFGATSSDGDDKLSHALYVERVNCRGDARGDARGDKGLSV